MDVWAGGEGLRTVGGDVSGEAVDMISRVLWRGGTVAVKADGPQADQSDVHKKRNRGRAEDRTGDEG